MKIAISPCAFSYHQLSARDGCMVPVCMCTTHNVVVWTMPAPEEGCPVAKVQRDINNTLGTIAEAFEVLTHGQPIQLNQPKAEGDFGG